MKRPGPALIIGTAIGLGAAGAVGFFAARGPDPSAIPTTAEVERRIQSPYCPGLLLSECSHPKSAELRAEIGERIGRGSDNRSIDRWLVQNYGEAILARPSGVTAWLVPAGLIGAALILLVVGVPRAGPRDSGEPPSVSPEDRRRIDAELRGYMETGSE